VVTPIKVVTPDMGKGA